MTDPTIKEMARAVAKELEDESRWAKDWFAFDESGERIGTGLAAHNASRLPDACRWCVSGHASRLFGETWEQLWIAYNHHFGSVMHVDNDTLGREYVRARLLELADHEAKR